MKLNAEPLKRCTPEEVGLSSKAVLELVRKLESFGHEIHGLMISRHGQVVAEGWWAPYSPDIPHSCHSLGKSYTCTAVGIACTEGLLSPEDRMIDLFQEEIERLGVTPHPLFEKIRVRDVMCMGSGMERMPPFDEEWMKNFLCEPIPYEPGTHFYYNTVGSCMLGALVEKLSGEDLKSYLKSRLFAHIGIDAERFIWMKFKDGKCAEPGVCATTEDNLRLGLFYLNNGFADGRQIIDPKWLKEATSVQIATSSPSPEASCGYGWQLWRCSVPGSYRFDGGQGQLSIIAPNEDMVIAIHQGGRDPKGCDGVTASVMDFLRGVSDGRSLATEDSFTPELASYMQSRRIPAYGHGPLTSAELAPWLGNYCITEGNPNLWVEVVPFDEDFFHLFYQPGSDVQIHQLTLEMAGEHLMMRLNNQTNLLVSLDGEYHVYNDSYGVLPELHTTMANAHIDEDGALSIRTRWLNGWFNSTLRIQLTQEGVSLTVIKDMLHENLPPVVYHAKATKA